MTTIEVLKKLNKETKAEVYIVGGFVRDYLRKKKNNDLDIIIRKLSIKKIVSFLKHHGKVKIVNLAKTNDLFNVSITLFRAHGDKDTTAQISLAKRGKKQIADQNNTLRQDSMNRDFSFNAMYLPIDAISKEEVIDYHDGVKAIEQRKITSIGDANDMLKASPVRIMRAVSLAARTGYVLDTNIVMAIKDNVNLLHKVPFDNLRMELNKVLLSKKPSKYFNLMRRLGILEIVMPELYRCIGVSQDKRYHKHDVYKHCIYTCDNIKNTLVLRLAAVLHDVGKSDTKRVLKNGRVTFHKHEMAGVKLAKSFLTKLHYSNKVRQEVLALVRHHMYHYTRNFSDVAVRRFIRRVGIDDDNIKHLGMFPLFQLRAAERLGNGLKTIAVTDRQKDFEKRITKIYEECTGLEVKDLDIDGNIIMSIFRLKPSAIVGDILKYLLECVIEKPNLNRKEALIELAVGFIIKNDLFKQNSKN